MLDERRTALWNALHIGPQWVDREELRAQFLEPKELLTQPQPLSVKTAPTPPRAPTPLVQTKSVPVHREPLPSKRPGPIRSSPSSSQDQPAVSAQAYSKDRHDIIASLDWVELRAHAAQCDVCQIVHSRCQSVFADGNCPSDLVLMGEAPGRDEDLQGIPFVGASGKLLDNILLAMRLKRGEDLTIINTLKCRPPMNRTPLPAEAEACRPYLMRQLTLLDPKVIVLLGRPAAEAIFGAPQKVGALRGKVHSVEVAGKLRQIIVTYHPSYLLRTPIEKRKAWLDWCLVTETLDKIKSR